MTTDEASGTACARCGKPFHCGVADDLPCWCTRVSLSESTLDELARRYRGCLCEACLMALESPSTD